MPLALQSLTHTVYAGDAGRDGTGDPFVVTDPSTGDILAEPRSASARDIEEAVATASAACSGPWRSWTPLERGRLCHRIADAIAHEAAELAELIVIDGGLPVDFARRDVEAAIRYFEFYAGLADKMHGETVPLGPSFVDYTVREPWGVCAVILPFNVPLQMAARSVAPALITGNCIILKPAEQAPFAALRLVQICVENGAPPGVVTAVAGAGATGGTLIGHPRIDHITFTGSLATGRRIMSSAAETMTPVLLELGGKSPQIVFEDADLARALPTIIGSALRTAGQACSAGTRVLVHSSVYGRVAAELAEQADALTVGPAGDNLDVGPVITELQRDRILGAVEEVRAGGATLATNRRPDAIAHGSGYYVAPTVLGSPDPESPAATEEIFGPVITVSPFESERGVGDLVNRSDYGLVAGIWTQDIGRAHRLARDIDAGQIFINSYGVGGGVELPFGGYKRSGFGRLKGVPGAYEYTQLKNISIAID